MSPETMASFQQLVLPVALMIGIFYFLLYRPQRREHSRRKNLFESLRRGDKIITIGGIHGEITSLSDKVITIEIADNVEITLNKEAIAQKQLQENAE